MTIPLNVCRRIIKNSTGLRAGPPAYNELAKLLEEEATLISETAGKIATHSGRKTINSDDILLAVEILREE